MAGKPGMKWGIEREVLACLSKTSGSKTASEVAREIDRTVGRVREWLILLCDEGKVVRAGKAGKAILYLRTSATRR